MRHAKPAARHAAQSTSAASSSSKQEAAQRPHSPAKTRLRRGQGQDLCRRGGDCGGGWACGWEGEGSLVGVDTDASHPWDREVKGRHRVAQLAGKGQHKAAQAAVHVQRHARAAGDLQGRGRVMGGRGLGVCEWVGGSGWVGRCGVDLAGWVCVFHHTQAVALQNLRPPTLTQYQPLPPQPHPPGTSKQAQQALAHPRNVLHVVHHAVGEAGAGGRHQHRVGVQRAPHCCS